MLGSHVGLVVQRQGKKGQSNGGLIHTEQFCCKHGYQILTVTSTEDD